MNTKFNRVIVYARQHRINAGVSDSIKRLIAYLNERHIKTWQHPDTATHFSLDLPVMAMDEMGKQEDLIIVIGGDGSLLSAARKAIKVNVPVIGINRGRLGFLTDILPDELEVQLDKVFKGEYEEEHRFLLQVKISDDKQTYFQSDALNDVVLSRGNVTHLVQFDVIINQQFVSHYRCDGMIIATPTGSTAYSLSAGGPILHPKLQAIVLVPMFSHSLSSRPIVIDSHAKIDLHISPNNEDDLSISCDGHESRIVKGRQHVSIEKNAQQLRLLHPRDYHYYDTLRSKLGWEFKNQSC